MSCDCTRVRVLPLAHNVCHMEKIGTASKLRPLVESNLRLLREYRALQRRYDRWGELTEVERADVFRTEDAQESQEKAAH